MEKITGVSQTLLVTLYFRYLETIRSHPIIQDLKSIDIVNQIGDVDWSKFSLDSLSQLSVVIRTEIIDEATKVFLAKYPDATVINIAAGLCTRFFRVDNGCINWYNIDLGPVKNLWMQLIGESDRQKFIVGSALNFDWCEYFTNQPADKFLIIIEGLSMYLDSAKMRNLIMDIQRNFPNSELIFDVISKSGLNFPNPNLAIAKTGSKFSWGIDSLQEIETWNKNIHLLNEWFFLDRYIDRWKEVNFFDDPKYRNMNRVGHFLLI